jgi:chromate transporter
MAEEPVSLRELFGVFFRIGLLSFGGGLSAWIHRETVVMRSWLTQEDFLSGLALAQVLPGANVSNLAIYIGTRLRGGIGASVALIGLVAGPFVVVILFSLVYRQVADVPVFHAIMNGITAAAIGMVARVALAGAAPIRRKPLALAVMAGVALAVGVLQWPLVPVMIVAAPLSVALAWNGAAA